MLKERTERILHPVAGLLSARDFLNAMAFRIFHSTQHICHYSRPLCTPEPDVCHELLGHVSLFADPEFADFSHQIGLASLGASDEQIKQLGTLYWWSIEFGLCREDGQVRAYGAGLLSSYSELEYSLSDKPRHQHFDPFKASRTDYHITTYQPFHFVTESFEDATRRFKEFTAPLPRPFVLRYNPYTSRSKSSTRSANSSPSSRRPRPTSPCSLRRSPSCPSPHRQPD
jgi:phenylalanine-4-hydroxylase